MRRTARQLSESPGPQPPWGETLWRPTKEIWFPAPVAAVSGRFRDEVVYCVGGKSYAREYVTPADPKTWRQLDERVAFPTPQQAWKNLTAAQRDGWRAYAKEHFPPEKGFYFSNPGLNAFTKAQTPRLAWGASMSWTPPVLAPPEAAWELIEVSAPAPGQIAFRVIHGMTDIDGFRLELRMTAATINARKPQEPQFNRAGETAEESFFPLAPSGAAYLMERPRDSVAPGQRFGLGVRFVTPEGIPGPELRADLIRRESAPMAAPGGTERPADGFEADVLHAIAEREFQSMPTAPSSAHPRSDSGPASEAVPIWTNPLTAGSGRRSNRIRSPEPGRICPVTEISKALFMQKSIATLALIAAGFLAWGSPVQAKMSKSISYDFEYAATGSGGGSSESLSGDYSMVSMAVTEGCATASSSSADYSMEPLIGADEDAPTAAGDWMLFF